ncbi:uncharacterized protein LOC114256962 [Camellia sinensis]|uniref:uncharacterized protein LOC114256962 n=1 Tax=Camellia sinensis TaxID=4442 RepID=UPI0010367587|nr:uncharacterized protein LOC114256962 [Camellia sinensis]
MAPYEALYGKKCRSPVCWTEVGEKQIMEEEIRPNIIEETTEKIKLIQDRLKIAQDRQKSYVDSRRRNLDLNIGDSAFVKISPLKGVVRFGKRGKLNPRFVGPFRITKRVGPVAYRLALTPKLAGVHDVFHILMLKPYVPDSSHVRVPESAEVQLNLTYIVKLIRIMDRKVTQLRNKVIPLVKFWWDNNANGEATWETEEDIRTLYPYLFE